MLPSDEPGNIVCMSKTVFYKPSWTLDVPHLDWAWVGKKAFQRQWFHRQRGHMKKVLDIEKCSEAREGLAAEELKDVPQDWKITCNGGAVRNKEENFEGSRSWSLLGSQVEPLEPDAIAIKLFLRQKLKPEQMGQGQA